MDPIEALKVMAKCWTGVAFSPPDYYMGHSETCGGKGNDRACPCASNQARGAFKRGREAITAALRALDAQPLSLSAGDERPLALDGQVADPTAKFQKLFPLGTFHRSDFPDGHIDFTAESLGAIVENWKRAGSPELPVDYFHLGASHVAQDVPIENKVAAGWIQSLELRADGLYAQMKWTDRAREHIKADELRYLSPYFHPNAVDRKTGKRQGMTLQGAGLLNDPFLQDLPRVAASSTVAARDATPHVTSRTGEEMTPEELRKSIGLAANATEAEVKARLKDLSDAKAAADTSAAEAKALATKNADALALAEKSKADHDTQLKALQLAAAESKKELDALKAKQLSEAADSVVTKLETGFHIVADQKADVKAYALANGPEKAWEFFSKFKNPVAGAGETGLTGNDTGDHVKLAASAKEANEKLNTLAASMAATKKIPVYEAMNLVMADAANDKLVSLAMQASSKREF